ncbi:MAG TPA: hypothetical protein DEG92_07125 [Rikenellaceae bacterium]|nr:hypothetical protein [Rikenellaceae bacterium]
MNNPNQNNFPISGNSISTTNINPSEDLGTQLEYLFDPGDVFEVTAFNFKESKHPLWNNEWTSGATITGYFDDISKAINVITQLDGDVKPESITVSLNPVNPELLGRACNRLKASKNPIRASDKDIFVRKNILIDIDPVKSTGVSSTDEQVKIAEEVAVRILQKTKELNLPEPLKALSGNGFHLIFKIDLDNSDTTTKLVKSFIEALSEEFSNDFAKVDTMVTNPSRLVKAYGTHARKGDPTPNQPHRLASIVSTPEDPQPISRLFLEQVDASFSQEKTANIVAQGKTTSISANGTIPKLDVSLYLASYNRTVVKIEQHGGATFHCLDQCLFDTNHGQGKAAVCISENGTLFYKCFHNSCKSHTWDEARQIISGDDKLQKFLIGFEGDFEPILGTQLTGADILKLQLPPVNDLVENMIGQEEATIVSGPAGVGKSVLTLNIALALGSPQIGKLWGLEVRNEVKTLFFQSENSARATQNRLHLISRDHFLSNGIKNIVFPSFGTDDIRVSKGYLGDPAFIELLLRHIEMSGAELVVIDPLISFHNGDENDNSEMRRSLDNITDVISRTKCSFLVIHHVGKIYIGKRTSFAGRGASSIGDFADNNYLFEKNYSTGHLLLTNQKTRNAEEVDAMELMMDDNLVLHHLQGNSSTKSLANNNTAIQALSLLGGRVTKQKDLVDQISNLTGKSSGVSRTIVTL